ncbi:activating signal cointegrator 1 [Episyrphus balteatus]|uniref:activating signal cointegrator 1 n=1 Tax=Episyrphus balteatus TaxID=286459 RepID=UPI002486BE15|nr:activating signal cointegrator 1 [Episyrphus balteatus]
MEKWIQDRLSTCLDFEVPDDMIKYIMTLKSSEEFDEYFASLLNPDYEEHRIFMVDCKQRLFSKAIPNKKAPNQNQQQTKNQIANKKQERTTSVSQSGIENAGGKKKNKFVNLFSNDGKVPNTIMLKGRRPCVCEATEHKLVNNCLGCGRIVCEQEGSGPCLFCGELVCSNEEMLLIKSSTKKGDHLKKTLQEKGGGEGLRKALEQRDRLLEYDRNGEKRTEVIDDESDYFQENSVWLSDAERQKFERLKQEMHERKHANRSSRRVKMDLFGREIEEDPIPEEYEQQVRKEIADTISKQTDSWSNRKYERSIDDSDISDPRNEGPKPVYTRVGPHTHSTHGMENVDMAYNRVQDKELMEMQDMRRCMSMHQPYASLLVSGIKKHEGRTWYSSHRGRLWIASTAKEPSREEISEVEDFYKKHYKDDSIKFPSQYQSACLLGSVLVQDVLTQEEYRKKYPDGESESPYVFICTNPQVLPVVFPNKGSHKIYQIEPKIHRAASLALLRANSSAAA